MHLLRSHDKLHMEECFCIDLLLTHEVPQYYFIMRSQISSFTFSNRVPCNLFLLLQVCCPFSELFLINTVNNVWIIDCKFTYVAARRFWVKLNIKSNTILIESELLYQVGCTSLCLTEFVCSMKLVWWLPGHQAILYCQKLSFLSNLLGCAHTYQLVQLYKQIVFF
jgi:hypothetical protein